MDSLYIPKMISIIVPMYKVEKFIGKCLQSILNQTYNNIEIIAVNDCSPDNSLAIAQSISKKDSRLKVVNLESNHGVSYARHIGLQYSKGEYVMFVDGDDYLPDNSVKTLYESIVSTKADIVEGNSTRVLDSYGLFKKYRPQTELLLEHEELMEKYFISFFGVNILGVQLWAKLYSHKLLDETNAMAPTDYRMGEDLIANLKMFPYVKRYCRIANPVYNYRWGGGQVTTIQRFTTT